MILLSGIIENLTTRKDKTIKITFGSQELNPNQAAELFQNNQQFCYFAIKNEPFIDSEKELIGSLKSDYEAKTPSQRLRNILYRLFNDDNEGFSDFQNYYISKMETIISHYKNKLDEKTH